MKTSKTTEVILIIVMIIFHSAFLLPILSVFNFTTSQLFTSCIFIGTVYTKIVWNQQTLENKIFELKQLIEKQNEK